jgi:hypothetical protein
MWTGRTLLRLSASCSHGASEGRRSSAARCRLRSARTPGDPTDSASPFRVSKGAAASWPHGIAYFSCPPITILCSRKGSSASARSPTERQRRVCDRTVKLWPVGRVSLLATHGLVGPNREAINTPQRVTSCGRPLPARPPASADAWTGGRRGVQRAVRARQWSSRGHGTDGPGLAGRLAAKSAVGTHC